MKGKDGKCPSSEERDVSAGYGQKPAASSQGMWRWDEATRGAACPTASISRPQFTLSVSPLASRGFLLRLSFPQLPFSLSLHYHPVLKTQRQDADDGGLGLPALGLATWVRAVKGTCGGSLPALPSHRDISLWVQFRRAEREIPVGVQALQWMWMTKTQEWDGVGAVMRMEPTRNGMGRNPPPREGEEAETINTFASVIQNPSVFTEGSRAPTAACGVPGLQHSPRSWRPMQVLSGNGGPPATSHRDTAELQARSSFPQAPLSRARAGRAALPVQQAGRAEGPVCSPWVALNQDLHHVGQVQGSGSSRALYRERR